MRQIVLEAAVEGVVAFDIAELERRSAQLPDSRSKRGRIYPLSMVVVLLVLAKLAGEDKPSGIARWIRERQDLLWRLFDWPHRRMPCLNTLRTVMTDVLDSETVETMLRRYLHVQFGGLTSRLVTIDGKTLRGTIPKGLTQGVHLLAVYLPEEGVVIKQVQVATKADETKENEISAASRVLEGVDLRGRLLCADAMQTQRQLSVDVVSRGGDYLWFVKENQPTLRADVAQFFAPPRRAAGWHIPSLPATVAEEVSNNHGRIERRRLTLMRDEHRFIDWPALRQVFKLERHVVHTKSNRSTVEVVYGITSSTANATQLLHWTRQYWGIENGLHYRRDVTLREDATRFSQPNMAVLIATLNNFVIALTRKMGFDNLAHARRRFQFLIDRQLCALC